jgi:dihydrofolate reductase
MRKIIASDFYTIDGLMSDPEDKMEWVLNNFSEDVGQYEDDLYDSADTLLLGRATYKIFEGCWPDARKNPAVPKEDHGMADTINKIKKIVFSRTLNDVSWNNSFLKKEINPAELKKMKQEEGKNMLVIGSAEIVQQLSTLGLIDEYHLLVHPVVLGKGKPLFKNSNGIQNLELAESKNFSNGVVGLFYKLKD